jgi:hypothetical protein
MAQPSYLILNQRVFLPQLHPSLWDQVNPPPPLPEELRLHHTLQLQHVLHRISQ